MLNRILTLSLLLAAVLLGGVLTACGAAEWEGEESAPAATSAAAESVQSESEGMRNAPTAAPPAPTRSPAQVSQEAEEGAGEGTTGRYLNAPLTHEALSSIVPQNRVIVRTVDMGIIVPNVPRAKQDIALLAEGMGGWEVSSERNQRHEASISVRVPAKLLGEFLVRLRDMAVEVDFENSTSQDVTADFIDNEARLSVLRSTEARLLEFHARAVNVEETVNLEAELSRVQLEIEGIQGRLRFMDETSAYSLVNVSLTTEPGEMQVAIGPKATFRAGVRTGFQAAFLPPAGVDEFKFTWDFGDGSPPVEGSRTAPTTNAGERVTATVSHTYTNVEESPYIVQLDIRGIGDAGLYLGTGTMIASVSEIPAIEVFAGEDRVVDEGDEVEYSGSFTRPESLWDFRYRWDFGDGSATVFKVPEAGETKADAMHVFPDYRPDPYQVVLTVIAQSEAGEIRGSSAFNVTVNEVEGFVVAGWDIGSTFKSAVRALSVLGQALLVVLIWLGVFSPVWLAIIAAIIFAPRLRRRFGWSSGRGSPLSTPRVPWLPGRSETVPARPANTPRPPEQQGQPPAAEGEQEPTLLCANCGQTYPASDANGLPARFCPSCGTESPSAEDEDESPENSRSRG